MAFSTTSADYWKGVNNFFSTSSTAYWLSQNQGAAFSTTSADVWGASKGYITWPWTPSTNYGVAVQSTTTPLWMIGAGVFASSTNARPAVAAFSSSSGRALEIVNTGTGPGIWQQQLGTNAFLWTAIAKSENANPIDIAHNPDSPTLSTTKTFSLANNTNARGTLMLLTNAGTNKSLLVDHNDTTDWATVIDSTGFGLRVIGGGSATPLQVEDGTNNVSLLVNSNGNVGIASSTLGSTMRFTVGGNSFFGGTVHATGTITSVATAANTFPYASSTAITVSGTASTSKFFADGLVTCNTGNMLTWAAGVFGCEDDSAGGGGVWPFTPSTYAGVANQSTTTPLWLNGTQLIASSTLAVNATTTGSQYFSSLTSALLGTDENGKLVSTTSIGTGLLTGILPVSKGGTGSSAFTAGSVVFSNGTILTQDNSNFFWDDSNNRLGIGTTTPTTKVFVEDTVSPFLTLSLNDSSVVVGQETGNIGFHINDANSAYGITSKISNISNGTPNSFGNLAFFTGTNPAGLTEKVRIESNGQTGVGTTTPASQLHVASSGNLGAFQFTVEETDGALDEELYSIRLNGGTFQWGALTTDLSGFNSFFALDRIGTAFESFSIDESKLFINSSGNVGIATTTPQWPLSVYKTTGGQLSLINGSIGHLFSSYPSGMLVLATTSPATFASSTVPLLSFDGTTGAPTFGSPATTTFTGGATFATAALYNTSGTTTIQNTNGTVIGNGSHGIRIYPGTSTTTIEAF